MSKPWMNARCQVALDRDEAKDADQQPVIRTVIMRAAFFALSSHCLI